MKNLIVSQLDEEQYCVMRQSPGMEVQVSNIYQTKERAERELETLKNLTPTEALALRLREASMKEFYLYKFFCLFWGITPSQPDSISRFQRFRQLFEGAA